LKTNYDTCTFGAQRKIPNPAKSARFDLGNWNKTVKYEDRNAKKDRTPICKRNFI